MKRMLPLLVLATLAGCGAGDNDPGPGGVTVGEARALDEAAEMLEQRRMPEAALPQPDAASPGTEPATASTRTPTTEHP